MVVLGDRAAVRLSQDSLTRGVGKSTKPELDVEITNRGAIEAGNPEVLEVRDTLRRCRVSYVSAPTYTLPLAFDF